MGTRREGGWRPTCIPMVRYRHRVYRTRPSMLSAQIPPITRALPTRLPVWQVRMRACPALGCRRREHHGLLGAELNKKSMAFQNGELVALEVLFDAAEVMRHWSAASEAIAQGTAQAGALAWLKSKMAEGPKRPGVTRASLLIESRIGVGPRAWARAYTDAAKSADPSWRAPGPARGMEGSRR